MNHNCRHEYEQEKTELAELAKHEAELCNPVTCTYCILYRMEVEDNEQA